MASWLSGQHGSRGRESHDIRKYIRVHGRVLSQNNSTTKPEDTDSDDFIMTSQPTRPRPTKQLTLMDFKRKQQEPSPSSSSDSKDTKEYRTQESENIHHQTLKSKGNVQRLFLPALKFSTGVRRKATMEDLEANKENVPCQETESPKKVVGSTVHHVVGSPLRGVNHRSSPCSVEKKPKREKHGPSPTKLPTISKQGRKRKSCEQKKNETALMEYGQSDHFLSSRKRRVSKDKQQLHPVASSIEVKRAAACQAAGVKLHECGGGDISTGRKMNDDQGSRNEEKSGTLDSSDSDVYINTDELLAELSNCEKNLLSSNS